MKKTSAEGMEAPKKKKQEKSDEEKVKRPKLSIEAGQAVAPVMLVNAVDIPNSPHGATTMLVFVDPEIDDINELEEYVMFVDKNSTFKRMIHDIMLEENDDGWSQVREEFRYKPMKLGKSEGIKSKSSGRYYNELRYQMLDEEDYSMAEEIKEFYEAGGDLESLRKSGTEDEESEEEAEETEEAEDTEVEEDEGEMLEFAEQMIKEKKSMPNIIKQLSKIYEVDEDKATEIASKAHKKAKKNKKK